MDILRRGSGSINGPLAGVPSIVFGTVFFFFRCAVFQHVVIFHCGGSFFSVMIHSDFLRNFFTSRNSPFIFSGVSPPNI